MFCEQHQLLMAASALLVSLQYRSLLRSETDFFEPILRTVWRLATVLVVHPTPEERYHSSSEAGSNSEGMGRVKLEGGAKKR